MHGRPSIERHTCVSTSRNVSVNTRNSIGHYVHSTWAQYELLPSIPPPMHHQICMMIKIMANKLLKAQEAEARGDYEAMKRNRQLALILDVCGMVLGALTFFTLVIIVLVQTSFD